MNDWMTHGNIQFGADAANTHGERDENFLVIDFTSDLVVDQGLVIRDPKCKGIFIPKVFW